MRTRQLPVCIRTLTLLALFAPDGAFAGGPYGDYEARDEGAPVVQASTLLEHDRFWPYQVTLTDPLPVAATKSQPALPRVGATGVLIRVEEQGRARVDFGRDGLHLVPVDATDLVARANRVRTGNLPKRAPNFVWAIGPRLTSPDAPRVFPVRRLLASDVFVAVFADPTASGFDGLVAELRPLARETGTQTLFFPRAQGMDGAIRSRLQAVGWPVPFLPDHLSEAYAATLVDTEAPLPAVLALSADGRSIAFQAGAEIDGVALEAKLAAYRSRRVVSRAPGDRLGPTVSLPNRGVPQ